jgi:hypothetical protein
VERRPPKPALLAALIAVDLVAAIFAWRDLNRRSDDEVRGSKRLWRVAIVANPGNSFVYWLVGRTRPLTEAGRGH